MKASSILSGSLLASYVPVLCAEGAKRIPIYAAEYMCTQLYKRSGKDFWDHLAEIKGAGIDGIELSMRTATEVEKNGPRLRDAGLDMLSVYTSPNFFKTDDDAKATLTKTVEMAERAATFGTKIITCDSINKSGGKTDEELVRQTEAYSALGKRLHEMEMQLCIHYHTPEWEFGGREMLFLMSHTDPALVGCCLETHWSYRSCGNSMAAVMAHMKLFGQRTIELHLRQSTNHVWSETFTDGDIDHNAVADYFKRRNTSLPHIVLEQAPEKGTPNTLEPIDIFRQSVHYTERLFA